MTTRKPGGPPPRVVAAPRSGFVRPPPIARDVASSRLWQCAWPMKPGRPIVDAFDEYGQRLNVLDGPRINENPNDPRATAAAWSATGTGWGRP